MLTRRSLLLGGAGLAGATAAAWGSRRAHAAGPVRIFTFGYDQPHETGYGFMADTFDKKLQELSGGTLTIRQFPTAALGQEPEMAQKIRTGDIDGKKVRVQATKTEDAFFSAYHAVPIHMPFGQVYTSLQTGLVQIAENGNDIYLKNKHYEAAPVISKTQHEANNNHLWMSQKTWESLTDEQRKWVQQAADFALPRAALKSLEYDAAAAKTLQGLRVGYHDQVDKQSFATLAAPLQGPQAESLGPYAVQLLTLVRNLK